MTRPTTIQRSYWNRNLKGFGRRLPQALSYLGAMYFFMVPASSSEVLAQVERTFNWYLGDSVHLRVDTVGAEFVETVPFVSLEPSASISDENGEPLFYTNSLTVWDRSNEVMENGILFPTTYYTGSSTTQGALILPKSPSTEFYVFTITARMQYSVVDLSMNYGLGAVKPEARNVLIFRDSMTERQYAIRHANGRDWWLIVQRGYAGDNSHYVLLIESDEVTLSKVYSIDTVTSGYAQMTASPDGSMIAIAATHNVWLFDFDRCEGTISNGRIVLETDSIVRFYYGSAFSPNGNYLYITDNLNEAIFQLDLRVHPPQIMLIFQGDWGGKYGFGQLQLGADGRIYVAQTRMPWPNNNNDPRHRHLGRINYPDSFGLACGYDSLAVSLSGHMGYASLPNFPNYELGPLEGSPCDTLFDTMTVLPEPSAGPALRIIPTVGYGAFQVEGLEPGWTLEVRSSDGILMRRETVASERATFDLSREPAGMYLVRIIPSEGREAIRKMFKL